MRQVSLHDIAPRLARARDLLVAVLRRERAERLGWLKRELKLESLVAHRELQLVRALNTGDGRYIKTRRRKLVQAQKALAKIRDQARLAA